MYGHVGVRDHEHLLWSAQQPARVVKLSTKLLKIKFPVRSLYSTAPPAKGLFPMDGYSEQPSDTLKKGEENGFAMRRLKNSNRFCGFAKAPSQEQ